MKILAVILLFTAQCFAESNSVNAIAKTLYHEARGEGEVGIRAVASVIMNRASKSGKVTAEACAKEVKRKYQFSCWNNKFELPAGKGKSWDTCVKIAKEIEAGSFKKTHSFTHYFAFKNCNPKWAKGKKAIVIGNHKFLNAG